MSDKLKGLWGGGSGDSEKDPKKSLSDFSKRFADADGDGIPDDEVRANFNTAIQVASPEQVQRAAVKTIENLPAAQRDELAKMLQDRQAGRNMVDIQRTGETTTASTTSGDSQSGGGLDDLLGGLLGGSSGGGGGLGDILGGLLGGSSSSSGGGLDDILGGLLGGSTPSSDTNVADSSSGGGLGDLISGPLGKMIMGGIAAYVAKEIADN
ncbi:MAG: hypothetical protein R2845_14060 [Thermomicrobiales bacterium]